MKSPHVKVARGNGEGRGIRSVAVGARVLRALASGEASTTLSTLAARSGMPAAKVHRYLAGYITAGLARQDPVSGRYLLGPLALEIGLAALRRLDVVALATEPLTALRDICDQTVSLTVWGSHGPTVVRWFESTHPIFLTAQLGAVLPVTRSANGLVYAAFLPPERTAPLVAVELGDDTVAAAAFAQRVQRVRDVGVAALDRLFQPGISSLAAPVLDADGIAVASIALVGFDAVLDLALDGEAARALRTVAAQLSERFGGRLPSKN